MVGNELIGYFLIYSALAFTLCALLKGFFSMFDYTKKHKKND